MPGFSGRRRICTRRQSWWIAIGNVNANYYHFVGAVWQALHAEFCNKTSLLAGFSLARRGVPHVGAGRAERLECVGKGRSGRLGFRARGGGQVGKQFAARRRWL